MTFFEAIAFVGQALLGFVYFYPLVMAHVWVLGALAFAREQGRIFADALF